MAKVELKVVADLAVFDCYTNSIELYDIPDYIKSAEDPMETSELIEEYIGDTLGYDINNCNWITSDETGIIRINTFK